MCEMLDDERGGPMESAIIMTVALQPMAKARAFETYFRESVQKIRAENRVSEDVTFSLHRPVQAGQAFIWMTRFPEEELGRVSRSDWPFLVLAMLDMMRDILQRFAAKVSVVSSSVLTPQELLDQWNKQHGRFVKMSLEE
jgi:hypothetical protein